MEHLFQPNEIKITEQIKYQQKETRSQDLPWESPLRNMVQVSNSYHFPNRLIKIQ